MNRESKTLAAAFLFLGTWSVGSADAQDFDSPQVGLVGVLSAERVGEGMPSPVPADAGEVILRTRDGSVLIEALNVRSVEQDVDVHRMLLGRIRHGERFELCVTPCRLVLNAPLLIRAGEIELELTPNVPIQRWLIIPRRRGMNIAGRVMAAVGAAALLVGFPFWRVGVNQRVSLVSTRFDEDAMVRGGAAGMVLGFSMLIAGIVTARRSRPRAQRLE